MATGAGSHRRRRPAVCGRWNSSGQHLVYAAEAAALAVLVEVQIHLDLPLGLLPDDYVPLGIETDDLAIETGPALENPEACRRFDPRLFRAGRSGQAGQGRPVRDCFHQRWATHHRQGPVFSL